jgi:hypothetical protein
MLHGLEVMLERMKTHPEEFVLDNKYTPIVHRVLPHLTPEETKTLKEALKEANRTFFSGEVLAIMAREHESSPSNTYASTIPSLSDYISKKAVSIDTEYELSQLGTSTGTTMPSAFGAIPIDTERTKNKRQKS